MGDMRPNPATMIVIVADVSIRKQTCFLVDATIVLVCLGDDHFGNNDDLPRNLHLEYFLFESGLHTSRGEHKIEAGITSTQAHKTQSIIYSLARRTKSRQMATAAATK